MFIAHGFEKRPLQWLEQYWQYAVSDFHQQFV